MPKKKRNRLVDGKGQKRPFKYAAIFGFAFAAFFGLISLIFNFGDWTRLGVVSALGLFAGVLSAPELEPKHFTAPTVWQTISGGIFGFIFCRLAHPSGDYLFAFVIGGAVLGATARFWLKHLPIP